MVEFKDEIQSLDNELRLLHRRWELVDQLFVESGHAALLNAIAPWSWRLIQDALWAMVVLGLQRLLDPAKTGGKKNLTLRTLLNSAVQQDIPEETLRKLKLLEQDARNLSNGLKMSRNTWIAHADYDFAMSPDWQYGGTPADVRATLEAIDRFMHTLRGARKDCTWYHTEAKHNCDADALLVALAAALPSFERSPNKRPFPATQDAKDLELIADCISIDRE